METITITARRINNKMVYNKKFDDYDKGFFGKRISYDEYLESKLKGQPFLYYESPINDSLNIIERITYEN